MSVAVEKIAFLRGSLARAGLEDGHVQARAPLGHAHADLCLHGGLLKGSLHEVFPAVAGDEAAAAGFVVTLAARAAAGKRVLWLRPDFAALEHGELSATGILELGLDPGRFLLLRAPDVTAVLRAGFDALSCTALGALVIEIPGAPRILDLSASRRLVLTAAQSGVTAFLLRLDAQAEPSAAETRWLVRAARSFDPPPFTGEVARRAGGGQCARITFPLRLAALGTSPASGGGTIRGGGSAWGYPRFEAELTRHRHGRTGHWLMEWNCDDRLFRAADSGAVVSAVADRPAATQNANSSA
jgi:protein ImuA